MTFGEWYRSPEGAAWKVKWMAEVIGCSPATLHTLVTDNPRIPRPQVIRSIARLTGGRVKPNDWFPELSGLHAPMAPPEPRGKPGARRRPRVKPKAIAG